MNFWLQMWESWFVSMTGQALAFNRRSLSRADAEWVDLKKRKLK